jgi:dihydrofolate reductase
MRDLIVTENVTLDGIIAPMGDWFDPMAADEGLRAVNVEHREAADTLVLGRVTYEQFASFWPNQVDDQTGISEYLNQVAKYVVSGSLDRADWSNSTILRGPAEDEIAALKHQPGQDIVITGSAALVRSLAPTGLVDIYRMFVYPVVQGHGRRLFPEGMAADLELIDTRTFDSGVVLLAYRAGAKVAHPAVPHTRSSESAGGGLGKNDDLILG